MVIVYILLLMKYGCIENCYLDNVLNNSKAVSGLFGILHSAK